MPVPIPVLLALAACEPEPDLAPQLDLATLVPGHDPEIDAILLDEWAQQNLPGLSAAVVVGDELIHIGTYGYADLHEGRTVQPDDLFAMNSMSKMLTAVVAKKLALQAPGQFSFDDAVAEHVPEFAEADAQDPRREDVTVAQLLSNSGGLVHYAKLPDGDAQSAYTAAQGDPEQFEGLSSMQVYQDFDLVHTPGDRYHYSSYGFNLVGTVVDVVGQQVDGRGYQERVYDDIAAPYGMTQLQPDRGETPGKVRRHNLDACLGRWDMRGWTGTRAYMLPGSGWLASASSVAAFARGVLAEPANVTGDLWAPQNAMESFRSDFVDGECVIEAISSNGEPVVPDYGYGFSRSWFSRSDRPDLVGHGGSHPRGGGAKSLTSIAVDHDYAIVV
ncbi:MAG: serine hydrolase domain-containing protein, partial [Myxococcota bacterium]